MRAAKVQVSLRICAVSPEPPLLAHTSSESRGTLRQKARSLAPLNGWAFVMMECSKTQIRLTCHNSYLQVVFCLFVDVFRTQYRQEPEGSDSDDAGFMNPNRTPRQRNREYTESTASIESQQGRAAIAALGAERSTEEQRRSGNEGGEENTEEEQEESLYPLCSKHVWKY